MRRREFVTLAGGAATWPLAARAEQDGRVRRVGMLTASMQTDPERQKIVDAFRQELARLDWVEGRNLLLDIRYTANDADRIRRLAGELVGLAPDVLVAATSAVTREMQRLTTSIPIVFAAVGDPIANGLVDSIARPRGNTTGFTQTFGTMGGKWVELVKEAAPRITRIAIVSDAAVSSTTATSDGSYGASIEMAAAVLGVQVVKAPFRTLAELERAIGLFAIEPNGGLLILPPK